MRSWLILLGGLIVWTVHFFGLYAFAEIAPSTSLVLGLTVLCIAADLGLFVLARRLPPSDAFTAWRRSTAMGAAAISLVAVCWQALPALVR